MSILSEEDRAFWNENGYIVIHNAVPLENIKAAEEAIWNFYDMRPDERESWYPNPPRRGIMAEMYQHQALWDNRQCPRVHGAFAEILGMERLWTSIDRVSLSPPEHTPPNEASSKQPIPLHWDYALQLHGDGKPTLTQGCFDPTIPFWVQGVLYLTDTAVDGGAFACVPDFYRNIDGWLKTLPPDIDPRVQDKDGRLFQGYDAWLEALPSDADSLKQDLISYGAKPVPAKAGDLIIWHNSLPHGAGYNTSEHPRVVQYMTMFPAQEKDETALKLRLKAWRNSMEDWLVEAPSVKEELRKEKERDRGETAKLSPLGRKLLGLDPWG
jgi:ectoine hydroxylase-related dioxygenase (phytanoyl-CoA dioxygenase family)